MKFKFFIDLPLDATHYNGMVYWATSNVVVPPSAGYKRHSFTVDLPITEITESVEIPGVVMAKEEPDV